MTVAEKISQMTNAADAIPRLGVPAYNWWNECLHGVARAGIATVFPQAIGMAASFDPKLLHEVASATADEGRAKHHEFVRRGKRGIYQGLTFWSPNINIFRDPLLGPRAGDLRGGPVPYRAHGGRVREGDPERRSALLQGLLSVTATVRNAGDRDGDEVVQLYVRDPESRIAMPIRTLRGFERISLKRGEAREVGFRLTPAKDFAYYDAEKKAYAVEPGDFEVQLGASSQDIRLTGRVRVNP